MEYGNKLKSVITDLDIGKIVRERAKLTAILLTVFFVLQIIPILYLGRFNHPTSDDFKYGAYSHTAWQETGSLAEVLEAAVKGVAEDYRTWQGSYSALFLMRLEPTVFGEAYYGLVPWIMLGGAGSRDVVFRADAVQGRTEIGYTSLCQYIHADIVSVRAVLSGGFGAVFLV